jgi:hypothetical protein
MSTPYDTWISNPNENNGPQMAIATWSLAGVSAVFLAFRLYIRQSQGKVWLDDVALGISWVREKKSQIVWLRPHITQVLLVVQVNLNQLAINLGYGKHALDGKTFCNVTCFAPL